MTLGSLAGAQLGGDHQWVWVVRIPLGWGVGLALRVCLALLTFPSDRCFTCLCFTAVGR